MELHAVRIIVKIEYIIRIKGKVSHLSVSGNKTADEEVERWTGTKPKSK